MLPWLVFPMASPNSNTVKPDVSFYVATDHRKREREKKKKNKHNVQKNLASDSMSAEFCNAEPVSLILNQFQNRMLQCMSNIPFLPHPRTISLAIWAMNYIKKQQSNCGEKDCIHFNKQQAYVSFISLYEMDRKVFQFEQAVQQRPTTPTTPLTVVSLQWQKQSYCLLVIPKTSRLI